jgi:hypothetical protein
MTIIGHFRSFGSPTLIGDLLISSPEDPGTPVHIPFSRNINERIVPGTAHYVVGLSHKVILLNTNFAVAWSGNYLQARHFISTLEPLRNLRIIDPGFVRQMMENVDDALKDDLSLIALVLTDGRSEIICHRTQAVPDVEPITDIACAGTGSAEFREIIGQLARNIRPTNSSATDAELREGFDLTLISALNGEEFASPRPLQRGWGGSFELIRFRNGGLEKVGSHLSLNFYAEREADGWVLWWTPNFKHTDYWQNMTIVQGIEHEVAANGALLPGRRDIFVVGPPGIPIPYLSNMPLPDIQLHSFVTTHILTPELKDAATYAAAYALPVLRYEAPPGLMEVRAYLDPSFLDDVVFGIQHRFGAAVRFGGWKNRPGQASSHG